MYFTFIGSPNNYLQVKLHNNAKNKSVFVLFLSYVGTSRSYNQQAHGRHPRSPLVHTLQRIWQPETEAAMAVTEWASD